MYATRALSLPVDISLRFDVVVQPYIFNVGLGGAQGPAFEPRFVRFPAADENARTQSTACWIAQASRSHPRRDWTGCSTAASRVGERIVQVRTTTNQLAASGDPQNQTNEIVFDFESGASVTLNPTTTARPVSIPVF
jgi:hypothetical protein